MIKRFEPYLQPIGTVAAVGAVLLASAFLYLALNFELPRIPERQVGEETYTSYEAERPDCKPSQLAALVGPARSEKTELCAAEQEQYRIEKESLNQAVRATNASEEVLRLTFQQTRIAFAQAILTVFALSFTGWAAWAAARAARASERSLSHADEVMRNELRAYVHVDYAELRWGVDGANPQITLFAKNTGQTPARWFGVRSKVAEFEKSLPRMRQDFDAIDLSDREIYSWSSLGGGGSQLSFPGNRDVDRDVLVAAYGKPATLHVIGVLRYETIFGEVFETEFWFIRSAVHKERMKRPEGAPKGMALFGTGIEEPLMMQRAAIALSTYRKVEDA